MFTNVKYRDLRKLLLDLGFQEDVSVPTYFRFDHRPSKTDFLFRRYQPDERVNIANYAMVRRFLDERGLLAAQAFERLLSKAPA